MRTLARRAPCRASPRRAASARPAPPLSAPVALAWLLQKLHGRSFDKRTVQATYYELTKFSAGTFE